MATLKEAFKTVYDASNEAGVENKYNCSGFARDAVEAAGFQLEGGDADAQIDFMQANWDCIGIGKHVEAADKAKAGFLVVAGVKKDEYEPKRAHGHVVVLIPTEPANRYHGKFARAWGGDIGKTYMSEGTLSVGEIFAVQVRSKIRYYTPPVYGPQIDYE
jgi:hypothetical protein